MIEVNEGGSEAAAATVVEMRLTSAAIDPISFVADRPFVFVIADDETGSILFMGKLSEVK
jgi:serine protease inhibitor